MAANVKGIPQSLSQANVAFAERFYRQISDNSQGNFFFSPVSISLAFAMVHLGAKGKTAEEIATALNVDKVENIHEAFSKLQGLINLNLSQSQLLTANRLFGNEDYIFVQTYIEDALKLYKADLQSLDFRNANSIAVINDWVANKTNDKIKNLINDLDPMTALVLVNAIYFKGQWRDKFDKSDTRKSAFYIDENNKIEVDFMTQEASFPFFENKEADCKVVELPYSDESLSMYIFLPNQKYGLKKLEEKLPGRLFSMLSQRSRSPDVILSLPRFKFEFSVALNEMLQALGMRKVFARGAELSGIGENLYVSKAVHKAFVEVNEEGTEAAAATGIQVVNFCAPLDPVRITVDHPFLFAIVEKASKSVLFLGRVMRPEFNE